MFGNMLGWIISAVIVVLAMILGRTIWQDTRPTAASGWVGRTIKPLGLEDTARAVMPPMNNLADDAGELYRHAAADYDQNKTQYDALAKARDLKEVDYTALPGLENLLKAGGCPSMDLFKSKPAEVVGFQSDVTVLDNLVGVAKSTEQLISLAKYDKQYDLARKYAQALEVLGYHLYKERVAYAELSASEGIMSAANSLLISLDEAQNLNDKLSAQKEYDQARRSEYDSRIEPVVRVMTAIGQQNIAEHAGDFYQIAGDPGIDRVWRVEALRRIGRLHFNAENKADQTKAPRFLAQISSSPGEDPILRTTATAALNMTPRDNQSER